MIQNIKKHNYIDALRGYAILGVILVHCSQHVAPISWILQFITASGARGVQLFYITSALTLCMSWKFRRKTEITPIKNFFIRRFFRIAPMFYITIIYYIFLNIFLPGYFWKNEIEWWFIPIGMLFLNGFHPETINSIVDGGWSIAVEMNFYLILPFLLFYLKKQRDFLIFLIFSFILFALQKFIFSYIFSAYYEDNRQFLISNFSYMNLMGQMPIFAMGLLAYSILENVKNIKKFVAYGWIIFFLIIIIIAFSNYLKVINNYIFFGFGFSLILITLSVYPLKIFINKIIIKIGEISFSMYLTHFIVLQLFSIFGFTNLFKSGNISSIYFFFITLTTTSFLSYLSYQMIERNGILLGKILINTIETKRPFKMALLNYFCRKRPVVADN